MSDPVLVGPSGAPVVSEEENTEEELFEEEVATSEEEEDELVCSYTVGLKKGGDFIFEVDGEDPGLVQLLGLHQYAQHRLTFAKDVNQGYGFPVVMKQLNQIGQMMQVLLNMVTQQSKSSIDLASK